MSSLLKFLQIIGMLLVGIGLWHGFLDADPSEGLWADLYYLIAGCVVFYGSTLILKKRN